MNITNLFIAIALVLSGPCQVAKASPDELSVTDFGAVPNSSNDATAAFREAIAAAKAGQKPITLRVPPGRYNFFRASATVRDCHTSNSTEPASPTRQIAIDLTDIKGLTIDGPGATLMMHGQMTMLVAERCEGLTLRGLEFDFERPTFSELTAVEKGADSWIADIHPDSDYQIAEGKRLLWIGDGMGTGYDQIQRYDPTTQTVVRNNADPLGSPSSITDLGNNRLRITGGNLANVVPGIVYQFRISRRNEVGMWFNRCRDVRVEDVAVRAMHGFGILAQFTENLTYRRLEVAPRAGSGRTCASPADVLHFSGCKGVIRILDCLLSAAHDDAMNVHGTHLRIVGQPEPNQLRLKFMHPQTWGFDAFMPGDEIELVSASTLLAYEKAKVTAFEKNSDYEQTLTFDKAVAVQTVDSDVVENVTWTPAVEMKNCVISQIPTRGILLSTRQPILIEGTRFFRTKMDAVSIQNDAVGWYESGPVHDLTLRRNTFYECAKNVIQIKPHNSQDGGPVHKNIRVEDNDFYLSGKSVIDAKSVDGLEFIRNRFHTGTVVTSKPEDLVNVTNSTRVHISENTILPIR